MLEYLAFSRIAPRWAGLLLVWVACVAFTVIYLGMHWVIDILAGWLYAVVIFWLVRRVATVSRAGAAVSSR
jgi:membrane-associated phospholipid phosphatase